MEKERMKVGAMPESQEMTEQKPAQNPLQTMQMELHQKGAILTKAWSELFSFLTRYQGELMVKENSMEIAANEIKIHKKQLEELKPAVAAGSEEISKLQDEVHAKERLLNKTQSELSVKEQMLQCVQSDLTSNMGLLDSVRLELLDKRTELIRHQGEYEKLKSTLTLKEDQIAIKDNLLKKLQNQLMQENAELKEQLEMERRAHREKVRSLEMERRAHEATKKTLIENMNSSGKSVIEIPDSPPTLDFSVVEQTDFALANIISHTQSPQASGSRTNLEHSETSNYLNYPVTTSSFSRDSSPWASESQAQSTSSSQPASQMTESTLKKPHTFQNPNNSTTSASDVFFPLSVSPQNTKCGMENSLTDTEMTEPVPELGPIRANFDSNQQFPSEKISPGGDLNVESAGDGKLQIPKTNAVVLDCTPPVDFNSGVITDQSNELRALQHASRSLNSHNPSRHNHNNGNSTAKKSSRVCEYCRQAFPSAFSLQIHCLTAHNKHAHRCKTCSKTFSDTQKLKIHARIHTGEKPYACKYCGKTFNVISNWKRHERLVHSPNKGVE